MGELVNVTVVFTDLVDSTALASRVGPEAAEELRVEHFSLLRRSIDHHGGREVKNLGDGLLVVFDRASAAVGAAVEVQQQLDRRNRTVVDREPLVVRVGVSVGEADMDDDGDVFGPPVVEAARLCSAAEDGQVLVSDVVRALVGARGSFDFRSCGVRQLKGIQDAVPVCEVAWEPLPLEVDAQPRIPLPNRLARQPSVFAGRVAECARLTDAWKAAQARRSRGVVVAGEAGIGKTTLLTTFAQHVHADGGLVTYGRCDEDLGVAYQPWIESIRHLVGYLPEDILAAHVADRGGMLSRLVPELAQRVAIPGRAPSVDAEADRYLLFGAVGDLLARTAADVGPVLVVLDDLHWGDRPTMQLMRHVLTDADVAGVAVVGTYRPTDVGAAHPLVEMLPALHRIEGTVFVDLDGLDDQELFEMLEAVAGHGLDDDGVALRDALLAETDGNPFFTLEILRHLNEIGTLRQDADGHWGSDIDLRATGLPVSVRQVVGHRVARLGEATERVLRQAAVIGREFDLELLAATTGTDPEALLDLLDPAVDAAVVINVDGDRFSFAHALIEHALYTDMTPARRARSHQRVALALEERCGAVPGDRVGELAHHWAAAVVPDDSRKAIEWNKRAADHAMDQLAPDEAIRWYTTALELLDSTGDDPSMRCRLLVGLGIAERHSGHPAHRQRLLDAARVAHRIGDTDLLVTAALENNRGWYSKSGGVDEERVETLELALASIDRSDLRARSRLLATLGLELHWTSGLRSAALTEEALEVARRADDRVTLCDVLLLTDLASERQVPWRLDEIERCAREALDLAQDDPTRRLRALIGLFRALLRRGDGAGVRACLEGAKADAQRVRLPAYQLRCLGADSLRALLDGDLEGAEQLAGEAFALGEAIGEPDAMRIYGLQLITIRWHQGRLGELKDLIAGAIAEGAANADPTADDYRVALAAGLVQAGEVEDARPIFAEVVADLNGIRRDATWSTVMALLADIALVLGDLAAADVLYSRLAPFADHTSGIVDHTCEGSIAHRLGCLAALLGRMEDAVAHLTDALEHHRRLDSPVHIAATARELGQLLVDRESARSEELLEEAERLRSRCGLASWPGVVGRWQHQP